MVSTHFEEERKKKQFWIKYRRTTIHASPKKKKNAETNQMMRQNHGYSHSSSFSHH